MLQNPLTVVETSSILSTLRIKMANGERVPSNLLAVLPEIQGLLISRVSL